MQLCFISLHLKLTWNVLRTYTAKIRKSIIALHITQDSPPAGNLKMRTARGITCRSIAYPSWRGGRGNPSQHRDTPSQPGGTPSWSQLRVPHPDLDGGGYPISAGGTTSWSQPGGTPFWPGGVPHLELDLDTGVPCHGVPPPPWTDRHLWNITVKRL